MVLCFCAGSDATGAQDRPGSAAAGLGCAPASAGDLGKRESLESDGVREVCDIANTKENQAQRQISISCS